MTERVQFASELEKLQGSPAADFFRIVAGIDDELDKAGDYRFTEAEEIFFPDIPHSAGPRLSRDFLVVRGTNILKINDMVQSGAVADVPEKLVTDVEKLTERVKKTIDLIGNSSNRVRDRHYGELLGLLSPTTFSTGKDGVTRKQTHRTLQVLAEKYFPQKK